MKHGPTLSDDGRNQLLNSSTGRSMEGLRQKRPRLVLDPAEYNRLKNRILERDGWTCQCCGSPAAQPPWSVITDVIRIDLLRLFRKCSKTTVIDIRTSFVPTSPVGGVPASPTSAGERANHIYNSRLGLLRSELCRVNTEQSTRAVAGPASLRRQSGRSPRYATPLP